MNDTPKNGLLTTEFWTTLMAQVMPVLVTTGVIGAGDVSTLEGAITRGITAVGAFVASAWVIVRYIQSRTDVKRR